MRSLPRTVLALAVVSLLAGASYPQSLASQSIPAGSKVYVAPMPDDFHDYLKAAFEKKGVPLAVVDDRADAQFEISGHSETHKPGTAKKLLLGQWRTDEQASIQIVNLETGEVAFAYSANKGNSAHGKRSTAEACAKHLKRKITSRR